MTITIGAAMLAHLAGSRQTLARCWKVTMAGTGSPQSVLGFTNHDQDIVFDGITYRAATGFTDSDVVGAADLSVDNMELEGMMVSPAIVEADIHAGLWDFAAYEIFVVNWADLTMGRVVLRTGWLGEVSTGRNAYRAELRGLTQAYSRTLGELTQPGCRANLYDTRCGVDSFSGSPESFHVTGTLDAVSVDGLTLSDSARTEPGPGGGIAITGITHANPGVVTVVDGSTLSNGMAVMLDGVVGPVEVNTTTLIRSLSGNTFALPIDTSSLALYVSGGTVTPLGSNSGFFDFGVITMTSGLNAGLSQEVRAYVPGQWTLELPFPYALAAGDTYTMLAGCDKSFNTCKTKFNNVVRFRGEPYLPGIDRLMQVGKQGAASG